MAPNAARSTKAKQKLQDEPREESLQAIVLADVFETRFKPFTFERPRCLLPLANTPLIEYTLDFLASAGVRDVFICCGLHTDQVEEYINNSRWKLGSSPFQTLLLLKSPAASVGDVMRDLNERDLITRDFLLVSGDVVSNMALEPILNKHRARREKDKNAIMTMVLREVGLDHRIKSKGRKPIFVIDPKNERCLHYEEIGPRSVSSHHVSIDPITLKDHTELEIRGDLVDCLIDICTPDVLGLWSDNFDYSSLRRSFLHGVLKDYELNGKTIYAAITSDQYAARVRNLKAYDVVSRNILERCTYPLCPDSNLVSGQNYRFQESNLYKEDGLSIGRTSIVKRKVVLGRQTSIKDRSLIVDSTIGKDCQIGSDVHVSGSYVWDDVQIGDGTKIDRAVVASGARIGKNCSICPGSLISFGVHLADGINVSGAHRIKPMKGTHQDNNTQVEFSHIDETTDATLQASSSDSDSKASSLLGTLPSRPSSQSLTEPSMSEFSESDAEFESPPEISRRSSLRSEFSGDSAPNRDFLDEATADVLDALQNGVSPENISLELVSLRMKEDASQHQVRHAVVTAFMRRVSNLMDEDGQSGSSPNEAVTEVFTKNKEVIQRTLFDQSRETKNDQVDLLMLIQKDAAGRSKGESLLVFIAKILYDLELVEEDGIMQWWEDDRSRSGDMKKVRVLTEPFIDFLQNAEEESDDESEEDSDE
ncbi:MAG: hypothetical protein Q9195_002867 [Heterodermia aff. obscurata]